MKIFTSFFSIASIVLCSLGCQQAQSTFLGKPRLGLPEDVETCIDWLSYSYVQPYYFRPNVRRIEFAEGSLRYLFRYAIEKDRTDVAYMIGKKLYELRESSYRKDQEGQNLLYILLEACHYIETESVNQSVLGKLEKLARDGNEHAVIVLALVYQGEHRQEQAKIYMEKLPDSPFYNYCRDKLGEISAKVLLLEYLKYLMQGELNNMAPRAGSGTLLFPGYDDYVYKYNLNGSGVYDIQPYSTWPIWELHG